MPFIGNKPSAVPLTSADITDNVITSAKIVDGTITNTDIASSIITGQTAETSIAGGDQILIYDDSATALRKMTRTNFVSGLGGLTEVDMWRLTADRTVTTSPTDISANLERVDTDGFGYIGTGMTQSSGIFTFPSTGYYLINMFASGFNGSSTSQFIEMYMQVTLDNSTYSLATGNGDSVGQQNYYYNISASHILDVTSTANVKVKFQAVSQHGSSILFSDTNSTFTGFQFIKLGET